MRRRRVVRRDVSVVGRWGGDIVVMCVWVDAVDGFGWVVG